MNDGKPNFKHDCDRCVFLGEVVAGGKLADLYFCGQSGGLPTVIARYSDEGSDYASGLPAADINQVCTAELVVARLRAEHRGLLRKK